MTVAVVWCDGAFCQNAFDQSVRRNVRHFTNKNQVQWRQKLIRQTKAKRKWRDANRSQVKCSKARIDLVQIWTQQTNSGRNKNQSRSIWSTLDRLPSSSKLRVPLLLRRLFSQFVKFENRTCRQNSSWQSDKMAMNRFLAPIPTPVSHPEVVMEWCNIR